MKSATSARPSRYQAPVLSTQNITPGQSDGHGGDAEAGMIQASPSSSAHLEPRPGVYAEDQEQRIWMCGLYAFLCVFFCIPAIITVCLIIIVHFTKAI
ncbi:hypothetical protein Ocin01_08569 [Orchesella cincta]|uniref:Uncharacterized protein n=1 Tax=Orchesella cincta TaxID=48709 RepID=A0A1D2MYP2_ORCCI|nr:hypothetical protein Ocin01_08569 [Orchesella cincta]